MNLGVPQCKNCWRWDHATFSCRVQRSKYIKCNRPHKSENYHEFGWCCKVNEKLNLPHLETKKGKLCPHSFNCSNCRGDHQADSNQCLFWRHCFNREWHQKKYTEIRDNRIKSIRSLESDKQKMWFWRTLKSFLKMSGKTILLSIPSSRHSYTLT